MRSRLSLPGVALTLLLLWSCGPSDLSDDDTHSACTLHSDCLIGELCDAGQCVVQCREDRDCDIGEVCGARGCEAPGHAPPTERSPVSGGGEGAGTSDQGGDSFGSARPAQDELATDCDAGCPGDMICTWSGCLPAEEVEDFTPTPDEALRAQWEEIEDFGADYDGRRLPFGETTPRYTFCGVQGYSNLGNERTARAPMTKYGLPYHCTEYALRFICEVYDVADCRRLGRNDQPTGHAGQWFEDATRHYVLTRLERHENGGTVRPQPGDILAWGSGTYGHVAIIREVRSDSVAIIEQNYRQSEQDAFRVLSMQVRDGRYTIAGTQGWMRAPGARPACADPRPSLVQPASAATFETGQEIEFRWAPGVTTAGHSLRIRNLDTDQVVVDTPLGTATTHRLSDLAAGAYRWTVYYRSSGCSEPDPEGRCSADARSFTVVAGATPCDANACRAASRTSGSICDGNAIVSCGTRSGCEVELGRSNCPGGQACSESGGTATCTTTCTPNANRQCSGNAVYNYDSCGQRGSLVQQCTSGQTCSGDRCVTTCTPNASRQCSGNAVYNYDSCGQRGSLVQQCTSGQTCSLGQCVSGASVTANYTSSLSPAGSCNPTTSRAIYRGRASSISGNNATLVFEKCAAAGANIDAGRRWWVVVGSNAFPSEGNVPHYVTRREGTVGSTTTRLTISNVPIWPSEAAFASAPCGDTRHIFLITDGGDAPGLRRWYQYRAITFTKSC